MTARRRHQLIQSRASAGTAWTHGGRAGKIFAMPPQLTDYELETAARACRALAHVERESAEKISDPALRAPVQQRAQCAAALAERFERARKQRSA
jgi:hypothetical protein